MSKQESYYTPVGVVKFPKTKVNDKEWGFIHHPKGLTEEDVCSWKFVLVLDPKEKAVKDLLKMLDEQHKEIKGSNFKPYKADKEKNQETDEVLETGLIAINFTTSFPIHMVDAKKQKCEAQVAWGSKIAVKFNTKPVNNKGKVGLGRYVRAIQIIELKESGQDVSGFGDHEGYAATPSDAAEPWEE